MRKNLFITITALLLVGLMAVPAFAQETVLDFVWFSDGVEGEVLKDIIDDYQEENPDVEFNIIEVPYNELNTKIKTMVAGGNPPDLARVSNPGELSSALLNLNDSIGQDYLDNFVESTHPYVMVDGEMLAVPIDVTANGIIYNKDYFEAAGIDVPDTEEELDDLWTWEEWANALEKVVEESNARYGLAYDYSPHRWSTLLYQAGGSFFSKDWSEVTINSPEGERAVEFFVELHDRNIIPESIWLGGENPNTLFRSGLTAMHFAGNWMLTNYRDNIENFDWGVAYMPKGKIRSSVVGGKFVAGFKDSDNKEAAVDFLKYFSSQKVNAKFCEESLFLSARTDNSKLNYSFGSDMFEIFSNELAVSPPEAGSDWAYNEAMSRIYDDIRQNVVKSIQKEITPKEAVENIEELAESEIEDMEN
ncbi:carbohydrate ABC transporter substrate-binding protein (CUT1 family) [Halanaerobium saccharolyticum]|uniref:Carbohydrate ABC transporter substrate-binding protein (CUT1 family) n=1 Tax=Halanaerobium saccharolyticum TaxID=43595 RepID=A0A2T5RLK3_9FIRM|nr:sugar ABC transporter substrate-binding protein [Halanaerobium saccharolyticum]PTW00135.1 carbohydrate ABC transporter substrate-binding protein (CUT1 family) [Halanaerobium saccharolyticum]TDP93604.1 carbohydrate ABC transporter substrate-binding protein (CUT1 family) [Halanaerobium saccharolyticum]